MANLTLRRLLRKGKPQFSVIEEVALALSPHLSIFDEGGDLLFGKHGKQGHSIQTGIVIDERLFGFVCGPEVESRALAKLLGQLIETEGEKRELTHEVLNNYRELNLLYDLSERLIAAPEPPSIANMALREAGRLMNVTAGWVLMQEDGHQIFPIARRGKILPFRQSFNFADDFDLVGSVLASGEAEIRNDVPFHTLFDVDESIKGDLICAPLKTEQRILGVILVVGEAPYHFEAHHLKLINTVALQVGPALEIARLYQVAVEKGRMEQELRQAYEVQANLIPHQKPEVEGWEFAGRWQPALELSGDYYDFIPLNSGKWGLVVGDVADKGMPSSLFMVYTRSAVRSSVAQIDSPVAAIHQANNLVAQESHNGLFVTLIYGYLEPESGRLTYVNAGHNPGYLFQCNGDSLQELKNTGIPLGIQSGFAFRGDEIFIHPGDYLIFYTDGVTEAINERYEEFGSERLQRVIKRHLGKSAEEMAAGVQAAVLEFTGDRPLYDDLTILVVKRDN